MHEKRGRRGKEKTGVNKRYPSQFLSSCLEGTAAHVSTHTHTHACTHTHTHTHAHTHAHTRTHTHTHSRQPILPMADTDTAMQREMKGGREGAGEQAGRQGEKSDERRRKEWDGKEGGGTEAEKT